MNTEVAIAQKIAKKTNLHHKIIYRTPDWYPSLIENASVNYNSIWGWDQAHYLPLGDKNSDFDFDTVMLGFGCDTYFKGLHLKWPQLWDGWKQGTTSRGNTDAFLDLVINAPYRNRTILEIFNDDVSRECKNEFQNIAREDIEKIAPMCDSIPDLWELFWSRSLACVPEALNLVCLRDFTSERNVFSSPRLRKLSLTIPANTRASGNIMRQALKQVGKGLSSIPDSSSMLPPLLPNELHKTALKVRARLGAIRGKFLAAKKSNDTTTQCAWARFDRLIAVNDRTRSLLLDIINDDNALPSRIFDKEKIHMMAEKHIKLEADYGTQLILLMTFGIYHRKIVHLLK